MRHKDKSKGAKQNDMGRNAKATSGVITVVNLKNVF